LTASAVNGHAADGGTVAPKAIGENGGIGGTNEDISTIAEHFGDLACCFLVVGQQITQHPLVESQHFAVEQQPSWLVVQQAL
jgi:hypothetical protein